MKQNRIQKAVGLLLCLVMLLTMLPCIPAQAQAAQTLASDTTGDLTWALSEDGIFTLTGEGYMADYESAEDVPWHGYAAQIKALSIGSNVRSIGDYAFANCVNLQSVLIPERVLSMGYGAFADSGLENIYVYSRGMKFDQVVYDDSITLPVNCVIHGYESSDAHNYCGRNERTFEMLTEGYLFDADSGNSTFPMARGAGEYRIADMWKASTAAAGSDDSIQLDYTLTVDADELQETYNNMQAYSSYLIGDEYYNNGHWDIEIHFSLNEGYEGTSFSCGASYGYSEKDMKGNENKDYHKWHTYSNTPYLTMTSDGTKLYIHVDGTIKDLYDSVMAQRTEDGDPIEFRPDRFYLHVIARGETYKYNSYYVDKSTYIDSEHMTIFDAHHRDSVAEADWMLTLDRALTVEDWPYYEGNPTPEELAKFYEPVSRHYVWDYAISREAYFYDENTETDIWAGECFRNLEGDGMATEWYNGILYGGVRGSYDAGSDSTVTLREILPADHEAFVETLKGVEATGFGGETRIELNYTLTLTFADDTEVVLEGGVADEGSMIAGVCLHTCQVCGMCTSDKLLACNSKYGSRNNECTCDVPSPSIVSTSVDDAQIVADQSFCYYGDVTAVVETFDEEAAITTDYYKAVTQNLGSADVLTVYDITLYNEYNEAITLNQWGGTDEYITISIPVSTEVAAAAVEGLLDLYHVDKNGVAELVPMTVDTVNNILTFKGYQFSPFVLVKKPASIYYGRSQLAKMPKASALLYAYDQIVEGVENCADSISVYNGSTYLTAGEIAAVWDTYTRDYAHHFWLRNEWSYSYNDDGIVSVSPTYLKFDTNLETARAKFEAEAAEILSGITASMSDYEKELYLHDELASRIVYAGSTNAHNAYGALVDGVAVCEGYAEALQYLLHQVDVPSFLVTGSSYDPKSGTLVGHKWNAVKIGGNWYHVDLTWDDQGDELYHAYFNLTTARLQEDHLIESASVALPVCNSEDAFYFTGEETLLETYDAATVGKLLKDNGYHVHVYVPGDVEAFVNWYNNNIGTLASQAGIPYYMGYSYSWGALGHEVCLELIPACDHTNKTETAAKAATCEDPGNNKYYTCNECHTVLKADGTTKTTVEAETLAPLGHDLADATCDVPAKCKRDGCDYTEGAALGHAYTNGFCEVCNGYQSSTKNAAGVYEIGNAGQLYWFAAQVDGDFENFGSAKAILTADISIPETVGQNPASTIPDWNPIGYYDATIYKHHIFSGTFDGNNKKISGLYLVNTTESHVGFFEQNKGTVQNLILEDVNFLSSTGYVGGIVGYNTGSILNCSVSGTISYPDEYEFANARGGIAGGNGGTVEGCSCAASISGTHNFSGGIVGSNNKNMIDCRFSGTVKGYDAGGIVGDNQDYGVITGCTNEGSVTAEYYAGGIVGHNIGIIENCRNSGSCVSTGSTYKPGGIAGDHYNIGRHGSLAAIRNCFSTADLPLVGRTRCDDLERCPVTIENSYNYSANGYGIVENAKGTVITNCFYLAESETDSLESTSFKTAEQFASGEVAYLLNGDQSTITWFQTCGTGLPAFSGQQVYKNQTGGCDDTTYTYTYSNTQDAAVTIHTPGAAVEENHKEPTCTETGSYEKVIRCSICETELSRETVSVDAKGHDEIPHEAKEPTCTEIGWDAYVTCSRCAYSTYAEKAALDHDEIGHEAKTPTCTEIGWDAYVTCSRCAYSTYAEKAALDHDMVETSAAVDPDCVNPGKTAVLSCTRCSHTDGGDPIDPKGHDMAEATCDVPAKCKRDGCDYTEGTALDHSFLNYTPNNDATCTQDGTKTAKCERCEETDTKVDEANLRKGHDMTGATCDEAAKCKRDGCDYTEGTALGHDMQETTPAVAPDCVNPGKTAVLSCTRCSHTEGGDPVDPMGHDMADATCTEPAKCKRDGCDYTEGTTLDHNYESTVTPPNCTSQGYTTYTCADCGYSYKANYENETGHTAETIPGVAPGCTSTGLTEGSKCKTCGDILTEQTVIPALEHDPETVPGKAATCANPGLTDGSKCKRCDSILVPQEPISVLDHTPETVTGYAATCTVPGLTDGSKCSACGTTLTAQEPIPVLDHTPETVAGYAATCTAPGKTDGSKCSACGTTLTAQEEIPILDHDMQETETAVDPGCETAGKTAVLTCSMCGKTEGGIPVDPTGHKWTDGTCTDCSTVCEHVYNTEGICTVCGSGCTHDYETDITNPTCTEQGYTTYTCKVCEYTYKGDYQNPLEHSWQDATCTEAKKCSLCGITEGEPKGHNYLDEVTPPSCTSQGYTTHTCTVCGDQQKDSYTDPTDHIPGVPVAENRQNPTCTEDGSEDTVTYCTACGTELKRESNPIPAQGHSNEDVITPPDCTNQGYTTHTCTTCGAVSVDSYTPATGHTAADEPVIENKTESGWDEVYYCVDCGAEVKRVPGGGLWGDVDCDGRVTTGDAALLLRYCAEFEDAVIQASVADVDADGRITTADAAMILRHCAEFEDVKQFPADLK